jgi:type II secretory pathway predicted ATPase ExeA
MTPEQPPLTKQDLREALDAAIQPVVARLDAITVRQDASDSRLDAAVQTLTARLDAADGRLDAAVQTLTARQEASMEAFAHNLSDLRRELMEYLRRIENRTERTEINVSALLMTTAGMSKSLSVLERSDGQTATTQAAQQRAIDDLYAVG